MTLIIFILIWEKNSTEFFKKIGRICFAAIFLYIHYLRTNQTKPTHQNGFKDLALLDPSSFYIGYGLPECGIRQQQFDVLTQALLYCKPFLRA